MRTITMTDAVLALITDDADRELMSSMKDSEAPEDIIKDMLTEGSYSRLFAGNNHAVAELHITDNNNAQESTMIETKTTKTATLSYMGISFEITTKMDKAFADKTITAEDFPNLSKGMLLQIATWQNEHVNAQDVETPVAETLTPRQMLSKAYNAQLSAKQKTWLRANNRYKGIHFEDMGKGRFKIRFANFSTKSKKTLEGVFQKAADANNWYCKVQASHVYINMHLG